MGTRRIKYFGGQKQTLPIKDKKTLNTIMLYLIQEKEHSNVYQVLFQNL